MQLCGFMESVV
jgi:hypothetical protein